MKLMGLNSLLIRSLKYSLNTNDIYEFNAHLYLYNSLPDLDALSIPSTPAGHHTSLFTPSVGMVSAHIFLQNTDKLRLKIRNGPHVLSLDKHPSMLANPNQLYYDHNIAGYRTYGEMSASGAPVFIHKLNDLVGVQGPINNQNVPANAPNVSLTAVNYDTLSKGNLWARNLFSGLGWKSRNTGYYIGYGTLWFVADSNRATVKSSFNTTLPTNRFIYNICSNGANPVSYTRGTSHLNYLNSAGSEVATGVTTGLSENQNPNRMVPSVCAIGGTYMARGFRITNTASSRDPRLIHSIQMMGGLHLGTHADLIKPALNPSYGILYMFPFGSSAPPTLILVTLGPVGSGAEVEIETLHGYIPYNCIKETTLLEV